MKRLSTLCMSLLLLASFGACKKKEEAPANKGKTTEPSTTPTETTEPVDTPPASEDEALPTALDFEDEAEAEISEENYEDALAALEKEVDEDKE